MMVWIQKFVLETIDASQWASGIDLGLYPQARTVMFGLSADF